MNKHNNVKNRANILLKQLRDRKFGFMIIKQEGEI